VLCLVYQQRGLPVTVFRLHGVFGPGVLGQYKPMIDQALASEPVRATRGAGGEYAHIGDVLRAFRLATGNPKAHGQVFNLAGSHTYSEPDLARYIVETARSDSTVELIKDPTQEMVSVSVEKLRRVLGFAPQHGEFLTSLIRKESEGVATR
jgi:nucleoside-diphosphate-sugar epimerase